MSRLRGALTALLIASLASRARRGLSNLGRYAAQPVRHGRGDLEPPGPAAPGECLPRRAPRGSYTSSLPSGEGGEVRGESENQ